MKRRGTLSSGNPCLLDCIHHPVPAQKKRGQRHLARTAQNYGNTVCGKYKGQTGGWERGRSQTMYRTRTKTR